VAETYDATDSVLGLARTLRAAGVPVAPDRVHAAVQALTTLEPGRRGEVYWATRLTLCGTAEDVRRFDVVFDAYFGDRPPTVVRRPRTLVPKLQLVSTDDATLPEQGQEDAAGTASAAASREETLRHRDVSRLTADERAELHRLLARLRLPGEQRRTRRHQPSGRGTVDRRRTLRGWMQAAGEPAALQRHAPRSRPRPVVLLVDVSGSMDRYADALLRFSHAASRRGSARTEVFALGTRLTRVTRELALRDPDAAMAAVAAAVRDAGGGTRLGALLKEFLDRWGQRGTARGAVVVVLSDGWERGDVALLGEQVARLRRLAHRVVWANPRKAAPGFAPLAAGMAAALPHVDDFVEGHSLAALEHLADVVRGASRA
jgi:uncharacterized protein with von Willebrand factor type A (vWA) domain